MKKILMLLLALSLFLSIVPIAVSASNPWVDPMLSEEEGGYVDLNRNGGSFSESIGMRFAIRNGGKLVAIYPALGGSEGTNEAKNGAPTFDLKIYKWENTYDETVAKEPIQAYESVKLVPEDMQSSYFYMLNLNTPLEGGEYLIEIDNVDAEWAIRTYLFQPSKYRHFLAYIDGEEYNNTLQWQLMFEDGNDWWDEVMLKSENDSAESSSDAVSTDLPDVSSGADTEAPDTSAEITANNNTSDTEENTAVTDTEKPDDSEDKGGLDIGLIIGIIAVVVVAAVVVAVIVINKRKNKK